MRKLLALLLIATLLLGCGGDTAAPPTQTPVVIVVTATPEAQAAVPPTNTAQPASPTALPPTSTPAPPPPTNTIPVPTATSALPDAQELLDTARRGMNGLTSFSLRSEVTNKGATAIMEGDFRGEDRHFRTSGSDSELEFIHLGGEKYLRIIRSGEGSTDWMTDDDPDDLSAGGRGLIYRETFNSTTAHPLSVYLAKLDGKDVIRLHADTSLGSADGAAPGTTDIWIGNEPNVGAVVYRVEIKAADNNANSNVTQVFSNFNQPVSIEKPARVVANAGVTPPAAAPPPATPTLVQAAPAAASDEVRVTQFTAYRDSIGSLYIVGEVLNPSGKIVEQVEVAVTLLGSDGSVIGTGRDIMLSGTYILPGSTSGFKMLVSNPPDSWADTQFSVSSEPLDNGGFRVFNYAGNLTTQGNTVAEGSYGSVARGQVKNGGDDNATLIKVLGIFYGADGKVVDVNTTYTQGDIKPGGTAPWEMNFLQSGIVPEKSIIMVFGYVKE